MQIDETTLTDELGNRYERFVVPASPGGDIGRAGWETVGIGRMNDTDSVHIKDTFASVAHITVTNMMPFSFIGRQVAVSESGNGGEVLLYRYVELAPSQQ